MLTCILVHLQHPMVPASTTLHKAEKREARNQRMYVHEWRQALSTAWRERGWWTLLPAWPPVSEHAVSLARHLCGREQEGNLHDIFRRIERIMVPSRGALYVNNGGYGGWTSKLYIAFATSSLSYHRRMIISAPFGRTISAATLPAARCLPAESSAHLAWSSKNIFCASATCLRACCACTCLRLFPSMT